MSDAIFCKGSRSRTNASLLASVEEKTDKGVDANSSGRSVAAAPSPVKSTILADTEEAGVAVARTGAPA